MEKLLAAVDSVESPGVKTCVNCGTAETPQWRAGGRCNACACYERRHGRPRPIDPVSLEVYPARFEVVTHNGSRHDARQLALCVLHGTGHPLTRGPFSCTDLRDIARALDGLPEASEFYEMALEMCDAELCVRLAKLRVARFVEAFRSDTWTVEDLLAYIKTNSTWPQEFYDAVSASVYSAAERETIREAIVTDSLDEKCVFIYALIECDDDEIALPRAVQIELTRIFLEYHLKCRFIM